ncbi:hypothetical protein C8F01DRAFT_124109 [Mycena amicta]|nr:hypothetical protein C8F01DRAFT_124109 [Mycena amicta]
MAIATTTFYRLRLRVVPSGDLHDIMLCGWASPNIQRLRLNYYYRNKTYEARGPFGEDRAKTGMTFKQLASMSALSHLTFRIQFNDLYEYGHGPGPGAPPSDSTYEPEKVWDTVWGRMLQVLGIRIPKLQHLEIKFVYDQAQWEDVYSSEFPKWKVVDSEKKINELMVG